MDLCSCFVALGGDAGSVIYRGPTRPVSAPEIEVLRQIHGETAVYDVAFVREEETTAQQEKLRLIGIYGSEVVELVYPGRRPGMEMRLPGRVEAADEAPAPAPAPRKRGSRLEAALAQTPAADPDLPSDVEP